MKANVSALALLLSVAPLLGACTETRVIEEAPPAADAGPTDDEEPSPAEPTVVKGSTGKLFGKTTSSYAKVDADGNVVAVGVVVPLEAFTAAPSDHTFRDDLVLEMPEVAVEQTIVHHLRVNWLAGGHGPVPYGKAHFDLHFLRGSVAEVDAINCNADKRMPGPDLLPEGYGEPELCVNRMGYHAWPTADVNGGSFSASLIMGYFGGKVVFVEPMIARSKLTAKQTFEMTIPKPKSAGGATTLYPTHMTAEWVEADETYRFELDRLETID